VHAARSTSWIIHPTRSWIGCPLLVVSLLHFGINGNFWGDNDCTHVDAVLLATWCNQFLSARTYAYFN